MDLNDYRKEIDSIDDQLIALFAQRMETAEKIAEYKKANGLRVLDARREKEKMREILDKTPDDLREIYSHEQAISQCAHFLQGLPNVKVIRCENTAVAARMVAESGRDDVAALSSRACRELYGLDCLAASVQDQGNNFTRFICIAKNLEIYPGADRTSLMMVLPHHPGSLYKVLSRFNALGVNMNKLESRPMPDRNFEFMFYFDLETSVYSPQGELPELCEEFTYLGSYSEVV